MSVLYEVAIMSVVNILHYTISVIAVDFHLLQINNLVFKTNSFREFTNGF